MLAPSSSARRIPLDNAPPASETLLAARSFSTGSGMLNQFSEKGLFKFLFDSKISN
jgi:hypothetical protein